MSWNSDLETKIDECDNCNTEEIEVKHYNKPNDKDGYNLCEVCSSTFLSHALYYPGQCSNTVLFRSLAYCTNMILKAIRENK